MPSFVSIGLQDKLHRRQSSLRTSEEIILNGKKLSAEKIFPALSYSARRRFLMRKFLQRLGKTRFLILLLVILGAICFYRDGWLGLSAALIGWCLGILVYDWKDYKPRIIRFLKRRTKLQLNIMIKSIILIPTTAACVWYAGWLGLVGAIVGIIIGELICRKLFK